jgi:aminocarboxymuconate-semialdehyde decarboxylase
MNEQTTTPTGLGGVNDIVDFHSHFVGTSLTAQAEKGTPPAMRDFWLGVNNRLTVRDELLAAVARDGVSTRVLHMSCEFVREAEGTPTLDTIQRINGAMADVVDSAPDKLLGFATVDAYAGEPSARELERAVTQLGLRGVFMESERDGLLPDAPQVRPTLAAAAALGVPVFLHPVPQPAMRAQFAGTRTAAERFTRATINSAAIIAMMEAGIFEALPGLKVVITALGLGGLMVAECFNQGARLGKHLADQRQVYVDTTGMHPAMLRTAVDLLGAQRLVLGTDWPVVSFPDLRGKLGDMLAGAGVHGADAQAIAGGNARKLLGLPAVVH